MDKNIKIALVLSAIDKTQAVMSRAIERNERQMKMLEKSGKVFGEIGDRALIAGGAITAVFGKTVEDARESLIAQRKLIQGFKNANVATDFAKEQIEASEKMQLSLGQTSEDIQNVMGELTAFQATLGEGANKAKVFDRAVTAAFDMQAKGLGDAMGLAKMLGNALQAPSVSAKRLGRTGGIYATDAPQVAAVEKAKGKFAAQVFLLDLIEKKMRGTASAGVDPTKKAELALHQLSVTIGTQLIPKVNEAIIKFLAYLPKIMAFVKNHKDLITWVAKAGLGLLVFGGAMRGVRFAFSTVNTAMRLWGVGLNVFKGVAGIASNIVKLSGSLGFLQKAGGALIGFAKNLGPLIAKLSVTFVEFGATLLASPITWYIAAAVALAAIIYLVIKNWSKIVAFFKWLWAKIVEYFKIAMKWVVWALLNFTPEGLIIKYWKPITNFFKNIWDKIVGYFKEKIAWIMNIIKVFKDAGKKIVENIFHGIMSVASKPIEAIKNIVGKIRRFLPFSPAKEGPLRDIHKIRLVETIAESIRPKPMVAAWHNAIGKLHEQMAKPLIMQGLMNGAGSGGAQFNVVINFNGNVSPADAGRLSADMRKQLDSWWSSKQHDYNRTSFF